MRPAKIFIGGVSFVVGLTLIWTGVTEVAPPSNVLLGLCLAGAGGWLVVRGFLGR